MKSNKPKWDTPDGHSPAVGFFRLFGVIPNKVIEEIDKHTFPIYIKKRELLLRQGAVSNYIYLIVKGIIHGYIKDDGKQVTTWLNGENEVVGALNVIGSNYSEEYLQAIEDSLVIAIPMDVAEELFTKYPETNVIGRKLWQRSYLNAIERSFTIRISSSKKRYLRFVETHPNISNRVPLKYIASYLGIAQETLSRIRSKKILIRP
jgi:CRP-like cAMP-binding protein